MALRKVSDGELKSINQLAKDKWRSSGITDKQAKVLKLQGLDASQVAALGPNFHEAPALYIPYFDLHGKTTKFFRVRYLGPLPGFAGQLAKPDRFTQEIRALNEVYLPPLFGDSWEEMSQNPDLSLFITEGELKAASACGAGVPTIGLGGVDVWRAGKRGITFLPVLEKFIWKERAVGIIYDSDLATKPDVVRAQRGLAGELLSRGAKVTIVNIPPAKDGAKQGLDDFIVAHSSGSDRTSPQEALIDLLESAVAFPESDALWELNEEVIYIRRSDIIIERESGVMIEPDRFMRHVYGNRHYMETQIGKGKGKNQHQVLVKKPLAPRWLQWEHRAEMPKIVYEPGKPQEYDGGWNVWPGWGCEPKKGDIGPYLWLMDFLFKDETKIRRWFERWMAYPIQHPGEKMYAASLLWSREQRIGKTLLMYALRGIYGKNFVEVKGRDLVGSFNYWAKQRQFVYADEINTKESRIDTDWLKGVVTQGEVTIKEKFLPDYVTRDCMNWAVASNHPDAMFLEDRDQRWLIHEILGKPADRSEYERVDKWLKNGGPAALFWHFLDMNLGNFNPREHAPDTPGKRSMILLGKTDVAYWVQLLKDDPTQALRALGPGIGATCDLYTPTLLYRAFDPERRSKANEASLGKALAAAGFRQLNHGIGIYTSLGLSRLYPVREQVKWEQATRREIVEHFDKFWAPGERKMT